MNKPSVENTLEESDLEDVKVHFGHSKKHEDSEGVWLISYADMMTLLMGFFALLLSMSNMDQSKVDAIRKNATETFGGKYKNSFDQLEGQLKQLIKELELPNQVKVKVDETGLSIIFTGTTFFDSGSFTLKQDADILIGKIIPIIVEKAKGFQILFEGHTDNVPISHAYIPSNWELSSLRASAVARKAISQGGLPVSDVIVIGWGDSRPDQPNLDQNGNTIPENQTKNRRVILKILRQRII